MGNYTLFQPKSPDFTVGQAVKAEQIFLISKEYSSLLYQYKKVMEVIKNEGIKKPFEVIQKENGYYVLDGGIRLLAAKSLGYDKVPCLIRDTKQEILLRKLNKIFKLEDENHEIKKDINDEEGLKSCRKNYYKLNIL